MRNLMTFLAFALASFVLTFAFVFTLIVLGS